MSGGETSLSGYDNASQALSYTPGQEQVYLNGILLVRGDDYTATNGTSITGLSALAASDFVQVNCYNNFSVASLPVAGLVGTIANNQLQNSAITINGTAISLGGSVSLPGDIESVTAGTGLTGGGTSGSVTLALDSSSVISPTIVNAKGDILTASADNVPAILTAGNNGETLVVDNSTSTGLRYQGSSIGKNAVFNSAFDIFQRTSTPTTGISLTGGITYTIDRWQSWTQSAGGSCVTSQQVTGDTTNLPFIRYCARLRRATSNTDTSFLMLGQSIENSDSARFIGQTVTFSFYARKGANYSHSSSVLSASIWSAQTTDASLNGVFQGTNVTSPITVSATLTSNWQRFQGTATISSTATQLAFGFYYYPVGTAGAADYFEVTGVQLELGSVATPYARQNPTLQGELAACQRYYQIYGDTIYEVMDGGYLVNANVAYKSWLLPVTMRTTPTGTVVGTWAVGGAGQPTLQATQQRGFSMRITSVATGAYYFHSNTTYYLTFSAEL
jgi:hypothetical protein